MTAPCSGVQVSHWPMAESESLDHSAISGVPPDSDVRAAVLPRIQSASLPPLRGDVAAAVTEATVAYVRLDEMLNSLPATLRSSIALAVLAREAQASCEISRIRSTSSSVAYARLTDAADPVVDCMRAIEVALESQADVRKIHQGLLNRHRPHRAGRWRQHQIWTDPTDSVIDTRGYVPPRHERVAGAMEDLEEYTRDSAGQPIATAAVAYAQFMSIQPFAEGNGRAGRALISHLLRQWGCMRSVAVPISVGINAALSDHSLVVDAFRGGDPIPVISSVAHAVIDGVSDIATLVERLQGELQRMSDVLRSVSSRASRADSYSWPMLTYLLGQPVITTGRAGRALGTDRISGHKAAIKLADAGIIVPFEVASHIPVWQAPGVLEIWSRQGEDRRRERRNLNDVA